MNNRVVVFGDEIGIPLILGAMPKSCEVRVVYDPARKAAFDFLAGLDTDIFRVGHPEKDEREYFVRRLIAWNPGLGVMSSYSRILWPELLNIFPQGIVNLHTGKLPEYRGANVLQWVLIQGERETAITLHYVDRGIDTGPVIDERKIVIDPEDTAFTLSAKMIEASLPLLKQWVPQLLEKRCQAREQDESRAKIWPRRTPGNGLFDWDWPDERIRNLTRALVKPWPGAFYKDRSGHRIMVDRALTFEEIKRFRRASLS